MDLGIAIEDFVVALRSERGYSSHTVEAYQRDLGQYRTHLEARNVVTLEAITTDDVEGFSVAMATDGLAPSTRQRKLAAVRSFHGFAYTEDFVSFDPTALVEAPRRERSLPKALAVDEVLRLLEAPDDTTPLGMRDRALLEFMYATGSRVTETVAIDLLDLDLEERSALVTGKGDKQRLVPLGGHAIAAIERYLPVRLEIKGERPDSGAVFFNSRGKRLTRQGVFDIVRRAAVKAGLPAERVSPHVLRHSVATHMVEGGADLRTVQEMLGHASISTTQVYTRVSPQHLYEVFVTSHPRSR